MIKIVISSKFFCCLRLCAIKDSVKFLLIVLLDLKFSNVLSIFNANQFLAFKNVFMLNGLLICFNVQFACFEIGIRFRLGVHRLCHTISLLECAAKSTHNS